MAAITGQIRHLAGPDAIGYGGTVDVGIGATASGEIMRIHILRGHDQGTIVLDDLGGGITTDAQATAGVEVSEFVFTGSARSLTASAFSGPRWEGNIEVGVGIVSVGFTASYAKVYSGTERMYSVGIDAAVGPSAAVGSVGANYGGSNQVGRTRYRL